MHPKFEQEAKKRADLKMVATFARLRGLSDAMIADILKDPLPYLEKASKDIHRLKGAIDVAVRELDGTLEMARSLHAPPHLQPLQSIESLLMQRNRIALKVLKDASENYALPTGEKS